MKDKLVAMLKIQDELNNKFVGPDWKEKGYAWNRYIRVEAYEAMEHYGTFKHWKKDNKDIGQCRIEIIDIWHFILSSLLVNTDVDMDDVATYIADHFRNCSELEGDIPSDFNDIIDQLVLSTFNDEVDHFFAWIYAAMYHLEIDMDWVYLNYIGKVALNQLRIDRGQADGEYIKNWGADGVEDNVWLEQLMATKSEWTLESVYDSLSAIYDRQNSETEAGE